MNYIKGIFLLAFLSYKKIYIFHYDFQCVESTCVYVESTCVYVESICLYVESTCVYIESTYKKYILADLKSIFHMLFSRFLNIFVMHIYE